jgi:GT2 family glycosyltransferase
VLAGADGRVRPAVIPGSRPRLSVVVAARDEAEAIGRTVASLLAQRHLSFEIIAVDDRSTDATGRILERLAADPPAGAAGRLVVVRNRVLPDGWLGKCHACHLGATRALGDWLLFMDGDVTIAPDDLLARLLAIADADRIDHLAVLPDSRPMPALQTALMAVFGHLYLLAARAWEIDRDRPRGGAGVGAFNLVRREAYERIGGHRPLRLDPADDYKLGRLLKESGARQRLFDGVNLVRCRWHRGALAVVRGLEKNLFAGLNYSLGLLVAATVAAVVVVAGPPAAALAGLAAVTPLPAALAASGWVIQMAIVTLAFVEQGRRLGGNPLPLVLLYPLGAALLILAAWNSALRTLHRGGVRWRDTFYPLDLLRTGLVPPGAGRRLTEGVSRDEDTGGAQPT